MTKQIKLLSLLTLCSVGAANAGGHTKPAMKLDIYACSKDVVSGNRNNTALAFGAAMLLGNFAASLSEREFDDKGSFRTIGTPEIDPEIADVLYACAGGTGITALKGLFDKEDMNLNDGIEKSALNAVALWATEKVAGHEVYRSIDRNHWLMKGWLPFNTKFDDLAKKVIVFAVTRGVVGEAFAKMTEKMAKPAAEAVTKAATKAKATK